MPSHILIIGPALSMGGMERASVNLANSLSDAGHRVTYLAMFKREHFFSLRPGIAIHEPDGFNIGSLSLPKTCRWIRRSVRQINPDATLVFNKFYGALTLLGLLGTGRRVFISERSSPFYQWKKKIRWINKLAFTLNPPTGLMAQTGVAAKHQQQYYGKKVRVKVIPNALRDVCVFPDVQRNKQILAVGRFGDPLKGFDQLIAAFAQVKNRDWQLVFAGGDEDGGDLKQQARDLGVFDRIVFMGKVSDIDPVYAASGIFVIPSRSEGFPNALCEAMAAGLPCISFDFTAGPRDIIQPGYDGILVENGNIKGLAEAIDRLIENPAERELLGQNARAIQQRLQPNRIAQEVLSMLQNS